MKSKFILSLMGVALTLWSTFSSAGPLDPDCTAEKAAKSAAAKATVGVGGRCSPAEAAKDAAKGAAGIEDKGALEKRRDDDSTAKKAAKKAIK